MAVPVAAALAVVLTASSVNASVAPDPNTKLVQAISKVSAGKVAAVAASVQDEDSAAQTAAVDIPLDPTRGVRLVSGGQTNTIGLHKAIITTKMSLQLILDFLTAAAIIIVFSERFLKVGFAFAGVSFLAQSVLHFAKSDLILGLFYGLAAIFLLLELAKVLRGTYKFTRRPIKIIGCVLLAAIGAGYAFLGVFSPLLVAGVLSLLIAVLMPGPAAKPNSPGT